MRQVRCLGIAVCPFFDARTVLKRVPKTGRICDNGTLTLGSRRALCVYTCGGILILYVEEQISVYNQARSY